MITCAFAQQTIKDLTVNNFKVSSTTRGSKPCPLMTETQRDALAGPLNGQCIYNTTSSKLNVYNGSIWKAAGGGVDSWVTSFSYSVGDLVIQSNKIYQCLVAHTSGTFATDLAALNWQEISAQESLTGEVTTVGTSATLTNSAVIGKVLTGYASSAGTVSSSDTIIQAIQKIDGNTAAVNLTGPITSVGAATSIASQTGTGTKFVVDTSPTLVTPNIGVATGVSLALAGNIAAYNYDKDNMLINGNIENPLSTEWTCTTGTCSRTTTSGEFSKDTAALKIVPSSNAIDVSQTVSTPAGIQKQGVVGLLYSVPATCSTNFSIISLVDGAAQNTVTGSNQLIFDGLYHYKEIPITFGATSAGVKVSATSSCTGNIFVDAAYVKQGLGTQNLMLDTVYSAKASVTAVVSDESKDFISGNCTNANPAVCTFVTGIFTVSPNCTVSGDAVRILSVSSISATSVSINQYDDAGAPSRSAFEIHCQKSGNDYLASSSANVYSQASANYDWTSYTPTLTGFSTNTQPTNACKHRRSGGDLEVSCNFVNGTVAASLMSMTLPNSLTMDASKIVNTATTSNPGQPVGWFKQASANGYGAVLANTGTSSALVYFSNNPANATQLTPQNGSTTLGSSLTLDINFKIPISGWSNSASIVGSFSGYTNVPGYSGNVDTFSVSYGTTNASTPCSASPCSYLDQIGTVVTSITRAATSDYTLNLTKTYGKLKCTMMTASSGVQNGITNSLASTCTNCNSLRFLPVNTALAVDNYGTLMCQGSY